MSSDILPCWVLQLLEHRQSRMPISAEAKKMVMEALSATRSRQVQTYIVGVNCTALLLPNKEGVPWVWNERLIESRSEFRWQGNLLYDFWYSREDSVAGWSTWFYQTFTATPEEELVDHHKRAAQSDQQKFLCFRVLSVHLTKISHLTTVSLVTYIEGTGLSFRFSSFFFA